MWEKINLPPSDNATVRSLTSGCGRNRNKSAKSKVCYKTVTVRKNILNTMLGRIDIDNKKEPDVLDVTLNEKIKQVHYTEKKLNMAKFGIYNEGNIDRETVEILENEYNGPTAINNLKQYHTASQKRGLKMELYDKFTNSNAYEMSKAEPRIVRT